MQAEYFDAPGRPASASIAAFRELDRMNGLFRFSHPFESKLPGWLGTERCKKLEILDVGAGTGLLGKKLSAWAQQRGWDWHFTNLDNNPVALEYGHVTNGVVGSALKLPFPDASFDLVVASQMTHHLSDGEIVQHWREAWRVTRDAVFICDLQRSIRLYVLLWFTMRLMDANREIYQDGLISVKRGFRRQEWLDLAARAQIPGADVWLYYGTRIILQARKGAH